MFCWKLLIILEVKCDSSKDESPHCKPNDNGCLVSWLQLQDVSNICIRLLSIRYPNLIFLLRKIT